MAIKKSDIVVCNSCGSAGEAKRRGSGGMELFLWLFLLWPLAIIYSIWRSGGGRCSTCGSNALIPINSPRAQSIVDSPEPANQKMKSVVSEMIAHKQAQKESDEKIRGIFFFGCASIFLLVMISKIINS